MLLYVSRAVIQCVLFCFEPALLVPGKYTCEV